MTILEAAGRALYGQHWGNLRHDLELNERSWRRMVREEQDIPEGIVLDIEQLLRDRQMKIDSLLEEMVT